MRLKCGIYNLLVLPEFNPKLLKVENICKNVLVPLWQLGIMLEISCNGALNRKRQTYNIVFI